MWSLVHFLLLAIIRVFYVFDDAQPVVFVTNSLRAESRTQWLLYFYGMPEASLAMSVVGNLATDPSPFLEGLRK